MKLKGALFALMLALSGPAATQPPQTQEAAAAVVIDSPASTPLVVCDGQMGTAFRVGPHILLTAKHVIDGEHCMIGDRPVNVLYSDGAKDYAILQDDVASPDYLPIDCGGFIPDRQYIGVGHARGIPQDLEIPQVATKDFHSGFSMLRGLITFQPGQSGGPVVDALTGRVVGIVNAADWESGVSVSIALKDTSVCQVR